MRDARLHESILRRRAPAKWLTGTVAAAMLGAGCGGDRDDLPSGGTISWTRARGLVASCDVVGGFQPHRGPVRLELSNGATVETHQPRIDEIFRVLDAASDRCGPVAFATE